MTPGSATGGGPATASPNLWTTSRGRAPERSAGHAEPGRPPFTPRPAREADVRGRGHRAGVEGTAPRTRRGPAAGTRTRTSTPTIHRTSGPPRSGRRPGHRTGNGGHDRPPRRRAQTRERRSDSHPTPPRRRGTAAPGDNTGDNDPRTGTDPGDGDPPRGGTGGCRRHRSAVTPPGAVRLSRARVLRGRRDRRGAACTRWYGAPVDGLRPASAGAGPEGPHRLGGAPSAQARFTGPFGRPARPGDGDT